MNRLIICEGNTDKELIGFYLEKRGNFKVQSKRTFFNVELENNQFQTNLSRNTNENIAIVSVGGKSRIKPFFTKAKEYISQTRYDKELIQKIIILLDRDEDTDEILIKLIGNGIKNINAWQKISIPNQLFDEIFVEVLVLVIPPDNPGAIERFVIDSLRNNHTYIIEKIENTIDDISINRYLSKKERIKDKAKLGCILSILSPEWSLNKITEKIKTIDWLKIETFNKLYSKILE
ncbi:hypothetical protein BG95_04260 [Thermosipho sp. 1063]|uniref:DUF3226 domain-containing protein n=1 Tax=unclassified Thermosipho (in: thermotogales) TaxID=2676525 RepID=UPI0009493713|nr:MULTISPECIES: DUF3226 domain-containing protein [unclassified Thermosipho (in: thermotogales)]ANQ54620.1 hypothetical protein Y592_04330 [Thermosipho sp. 1070]APT73035.1 hypothetical protein BG95_04260 [Thermosipho sp. 1063]OOC43853.1 hypothetical protein XO08_04155 [Thermosipho sp. 1074]